MWFFHVWICHIWVIHVWILPMCRDGETPDLRSKRHFPTREYWKYGKPFKSHLQRKKLPKIDLYPYSKLPCPSTHSRQKTACSRQRKPPAPQADWLGYRDRRFEFSDCIRTDDFVSFFIRGCRLKIYPVLILTPIHLKKMKRGIYRFDSISRCRITAKLSSHTDLFFLRTAMAAVSGSFPHTQDRSR